jgi:hypothetical protein
MLRRTLPLLFLSVLSFAPLPAAAIDNSNVVTESPAGVQLRKAGTAHATVVGDSTAGATFVGPGTSGKPYVSGGSAANPSFTTLGVSGGGTGLAAATAHYLLFGNGTSALTLLAPSSTTGIPLVSQGSSADPAYSTAVVAGGGTGITSATAGYLLIGNGTGALQATNQQGQTRQVRGVVTANVSDLTAFTVASNDGLTYAAGQRILLAGQTTKSQNGPYVVGTVASTTAPLTRPTDFATASVVPSGLVVEVSEGTLFAQSSWKLTTAATSGATVGTTSIDFYPRYVGQTVTLSSGTITIANVPLLSATKSLISINRTTPSTPTSTIQYNPITLTPGVVGTASIVLNAQVAAGTINASDASVLNVGVTNW